MNSVWASLFVASLVGLMVTTLAKANDDRPAPKVAVIVSAGDAGGALEDSFQDLEKQAQTVYEKLGFKVILIGGTTRQGLPLTAANLENTLNDLSGVTDLRVDFLGHGDLERVAATHPATPLAISKERIENSIGLEDLKSGDKVIWTATNSVTADSKRFGGKAKRLGLPTSSTEPLDHEQIANALEKFRRRNPNGVATLNLTNCFSGALAQKLRKTDRTIVYADAPHNSVALELGKSKETSTDETSDNIGRTFLSADTGLSRYYRLLGANSVASFDAAREDANDRQAKELRDKPQSIYTIGRSPIFESVIGWCEEGSSQKTGVGKVEIGLAKRKLLKELFELNRRMDVAANSPSFDGKDKAVSRLENAYRQCLEDEKKPLSIRSTKAMLAAIQSELHTAYQHDPNRPIQMMIASFEKILAKKNQQSDIVQRFKTALEKDFAELKTLNLSADRWGGLRDLINGIENKTVDETQIISKINFQLQKLKKDCGSGNPFEPPCYPDGVSNFNDLANYLIAPLPMDPSGPMDPIFEKCEKASTAFPCIYAHNPTHPFLVIDLNNYWMSKSRSDGASTTQGHHCDKMEWAEYLRSKKNLELDSKCVNNFIENAPEDEWKNLSRLLQLGRRNARGENETSEASPKEKSADIVR